MHACFGRLGTLLAPISSLCGAALPSWSWSSVLVRFGRLGSLLALWPNFLQFFVALTFSMQTSWIQAIAPSSSWSSVFVRFGSAK